TENGVAAATGDLDGIKHRAGTGLLDVALIGVEPHLAVGKLADRLAVLADIGNQHDRARRLVRGRKNRARQRPKIAGEAYLRLLGNILIAKQQDVVLEPRLLHSIESRSVQQLRQVDTLDFDADDIRQRPFGK